ncbi:hypothetical protein ACQ4PT_027056 [Festuca glaucescens]
MDGMAGGSPASHAGESPETSSSSFSGGGEGKKKVYVAVVAGESKAMVLWALHRFPSKDDATAATFVLLHVYSKPRFIPVMGTVSQVQEQQPVAYKKMELQKTSDILDERLLLCAYEKVQAEKLVVESDDVAQGLVKLISEHRVTELVMGAVADKHYTKLSDPRKHKLYNNERILSAKYGTFAKEHSSTVGRLPLSNEAMQEDVQKSGDQQLSVDRSTSLSETWCVSNTWLQKPNIALHNERASPCRSYDNEKEFVKEFDEPENKFQGMLRELDSVRKQAYEEICSREKAERELLEAFQKARDSENLYFGEVKQRNEIEEKLTTTMEEVERLTQTTDKLCAKLQEHSKKRLALEKRTAHSDRIIKDLMLQCDKAVEILSRVRHPNLVTLIGACKEDQALVYEYMPNGSLDDRLVCKNNSKPLRWQLRTRIISDVCSALIFLHSNKPHSIVHSDLKASNIILDGNNVAKLSGFGVCRMFTDEFRNTTTLYRHTHPKGSFVYIDPEHVMTGDLAPQSDVYSFGIVLLRLLTGRLGFGLLKDVQRAAEKDCLAAILDSSAGDCPAMQAEQLARVGLRCCEIRRKNRPDLRTEYLKTLVACHPTSSVQYYR